jgi:hypothetical protein
MTPFTTLLVSGMLLAGTAIAQCPSTQEGCESAKAGATAQVAEASAAQKGGSCCSTEAKSDPMLAKWKALDKQTQGQVANAFVKSARSCPLGSRYTKMVFALDRLYSGSAAQLQSLASHEDCDPALRKDLQARIGEIRTLQGINGRALSVMKTVLASADPKLLEGCCDEKKSECCEGEKTAKAKEAKDREACEAACETACEATCDDSGKDSGKGNGAVFAKVCDESTKLAKGFGNAMAEFKKLDPKAVESMKADYAMMKSHGIDMGAVMSAAIQGQMAEVKKACAGLACSKSGLVSTHADKLAACKVTNQVVMGSVSGLKAAHMLLSASAKAWPKKDAKGDCSSCETGCDEAGEKTKTECSEGKVKTECCESAKG